MPAIPTLFASRSRSARRFPSARRYRAARRNFRPAIESLETRIVLSAVAGPVNVSAVQIAEPATIDAAFAGPIQPVVSANPVAGPIAGPIQVETSVSPFANAFPSSAATIESASRQYDADGQFESGEYEHGEDGHEYPETTVEVSTDEMALVFRDLSASDNDSFSLPLNAIQVIPDNAVSELDFSSPNEVDANQEPAAPTPTSVNIPRDANDSAESVGDDLAADESSESESADVNATSRPSRQSAQASPETLAAEQVSEAETNNEMNGEDLEAETEVDVEETAQVEESRSLKSEATETDSGTRTSQIPTEAIDELFTTQVDFAVDGKDRYKVAAIALGIAAVGFNRRQDSLSR